MLIYRCTIVTPRHFMRYRYMLYARSAAVQDRRGRGPRSADDRNKRGPRFADDRNKRSPRTSATSAARGQTELAGGWLVHWLTGPAWLSQAGLG